MRKNGERSEAAVKALLDAKAALHGAEPSSKGSEIALKQVSSESYPLFCFCARKIERSPEIYCPKVSEQSPTIWNDIH